MVTSFLSVQEKNGMKERIKVEHLSVSFFTDEGEVQAVRDVSFSLNAGEVLAVVGESGCGKSVLCKSIMKLLPENAKIKNGKILVNDPNDNGNKRHFYRSFEIGLIQREAKQFWCFD